MRRFRNAKTDASSIPRQPTTERRRKGGSWLSPILFVRHLTRASKTSGSTVIFSICSFWREGHKCESGPAIRAFTNEEEESVIDREVRVGISLMKSVNAVVLMSHW
ncbi:hypothetical protein BOTBODRAFT_61018 [Botryobasidium botryosum FD-172 SS1]|uniref:Uncharacterized protein n=1 Tax=Botryobasidium botryosum (strain FD-172 SS1) TaxID=930990 RepID=A0A067NBY6_BOTB1|nr:hypothetical protein BOTBODRAFT_61018 [Botryobasidium botryosum FD-172 SS1]